MLMLTTIGDHSVLILEYLVLLTAIGLVVMQLFVRDKQTMNILFAIFCGSVAMGTAQNIAGDEMGMWQYLVGLGGCATCNIYWLLARSMFRQSSPFSLIHILFAASLGGLMLIRQGYLFAKHLNAVPSGGVIFSELLSEATVMLSSVVLILAVWEGLRHFASLSHVRRRLHMLYIGSITVAIMSTKFASVAFQNDANTESLVRLSVTLFMLVMTGYLVWQLAKVVKLEASKGKVDGAKVNQKGREKHHQVSLKPSPSKHIIEAPIDVVFSSRVTQFITDNFLQANLKVSDVARALSVSDYKVTQAMKTLSKGKNFNHYVNQLRIAHARKLLETPANSHWSIVVIGLESGFASVGPFTRAFKQVTGMTPGQYRQQYAVVESSA